jgi:hypothetical protein
MTQAKRPGREPEEPLAHASHLWVVRSGAGRAQPSGSPEATRSGKAGSPGANPGPTQCGARCALCRLSETRADSRRGAWPSRRRIRKHTTRRMRRPVSLASREVPRRRARFLRGGAGPCSLAASQRTIRAARRGPGVAAQGHAARRRLSERYTKRHLTPISRAIASAAAAGSAASRRGLPTTRIEAPARMASAGVPVRR